MTLADDLQVLKGSKPRTFDQWLLTAAEDDKELVFAAIADPVIPVNALEATLRANGIPITWQTIARLRESAS